MRTLAELLALSGLAITQPLLDVLGRATVSSAAGSPSPSSPPQPAAITRPATATAVRPTVIACQPTTTRTRPRFNTRAWGVSRSPSR